MKVSNKEPEPPRPLHKVLQPIRLTWEAAQGPVRQNTQFNHNRFVSRVISVCCHLRTDKTSMNMCYSLCASQSCVRVSIGAEHDFV